MRRAACGVSVLGSREQVRSYRGKAYVQSSVGANLLASQAMRWVSAGVSRTSSLLQREGVCAEFCRSQLVGEPGNAVGQCWGLANKFALTGWARGVGFCRSQLVGEPGNAVGQCWGLANKFAPTEGRRMCGVLCRSQLVGELGHAVCQCWRLANKFAPTVWSAQAFAASSSSLSASNSSASSLRASRAVCLTFTASS